MISVSTTHISIFFLVTIVLLLLFLRKIYQLNDKFDRLYSNVTGEVDHISECVDSTCKSVIDRLDEDAMVHDKTHRLLEDLAKTKT